MIKKNTGKRLKKTYVKTPTVYQMEATECGAASLAMVLGYYGKHIPLEKLRVDCGVSRDGSNAKNILKAARKHQLKARGYKKGLNSLLRTKGPAIIHWNFNHFVVYEGIKGGYAYINDPGDGRKKLTIEQLDEGFTGIVLMFEKDEKFEKSKGKRNLWNLVINRLQGDRISVLFLIIIGLFLIVPGLVLPAFSKVFIDDILLAGNYNWFKGLLWGMILVSVFQAGLTYMQRHFLLKLQTKLALVSTGKFLWHVFKLPIQFFDQRYAGDIGSRISNNDSVANFLAGDLAATFLNFITALFYLTLLLVYNVKLTLIGLTFTVFNIVFLRLVTEKISNKKMKMEQDSGKLQGVIYSGLRIIDSLKASGAENQYLERILGYYAKVTRGEQELGKIKQYLSAVPNFTNQLTSVLILIIGGLDAINGSMTIGTLLAFKSLMSSFLTPMNSLVSFGERIQNLKVDMNRLDDVYNYEIDSKFKDSNKKEMDRAKLDGRVEVCNLEFGYNLLEPPLIENFNFMVEPGKSIAFVGASGSGKSTVSKIVSGLYEPWKGEIIFDDIPRSEIPAEILNNSIATVSQDVVLFSGTIKDNISLWDDSIPDSQIIEAAKDACIHDVITRKPGGYEYEVREGGLNFSGGQRQRLEIARALAVNPTILILDEATSALDPKTEKEIIDNIKKRGCTCLMVAHRLSAIRDCDEIIVMENGKIVQRGTHEELKHVPGHYADLIQFGQ